MASRKHILCPTDFSACSDVACAEAAKLASDSGAKVTLLHVIAHFPQDRSNDEIAPENQDPLQFRKSKAEEAMKKQADRLGISNAELSVTFTCHTIAYGIITYAVTSGVDLIVIPTHANNWLEKVFGDISKYVMKKADCDVLVVPTE